MTGTGFSRKRFVIITCVIVLVYVLFLQVFNTDQNEHYFKQDYPHYLNTTANVYNNNNKTNVFVHSTKHGFKLDDPHKIQLNPADHRYTYNNKTEPQKFVHSTKQVMRTIQTIRYRNCRRDPSTSIRQACEEERQKTTRNLSNRKWKRRVPGCIIIGTFKSGTRELIDYLYMNPRIVIKREPIYEISFFDKKASRGLEWYRTQMPPSVPEQVTIEKSPSYFYSTETPKRIHDMNSSIKLILLVRDPVDRALSQFNFNIAAKMKYSGSFIKCAMDTVTKVINENCRFLKHSIYDLPISRYLQYFDRNQIYIIDAVEFRKNPLKILQQVENYLNIPNLIRTEDLAYNAERNIYCLRSGRINGVCYSSNRGRHSYTETLSPEVRQKLNAWFKPHNEEFFKLTKRTFSWG